MKATSANEVWLHRVGSLAMPDRNDIYHTAPRGRLVNEQLHRTVVCDIRSSLVTIPERRLSYRFAAAEALWIIEGRNDVESLTPYNKRMADYSDDGEVLAGAYGPRLLAQRSYLLGKLKEDTDTRQATATIWTPNPHPSKDIPCTISVSLMIRYGYLNCHVFMRSSDVWLGLPYDMFSFSCYATDMALRYSRRNGKVLQLGRLYLTAVSSHLYQSNYDAAVNVINGWSEPVRQQPLLKVQTMWEPSQLMDLLRDMRDEKPVLADVGGQA